MQGLGKVCSWAGLNLLAATMLTAVELPFDPYAENISIAVPHLPPEFRGEMPKADTELNGLEKKLLQTQKAETNQIEIIFRKNTKIHPNAFYLRPGPPAVITASDYNGFLYGLQRIKQLSEVTFLKPSPDQKTSNHPSPLFYEEPSVMWRSMHLDVSRHFFEIPVLERFIQRIAALRFNKLHLHLTDDQGWRFPVPGYPELTAKGGYRTGGGDRTDPYGGVYTADELRGLVKFAELYGVEIMPEVDMPGHCRSALAAMPQLSCKGDSVRVGHVRNNLPGCSTLCIGNPETWRMGEAVIDALCDIFPSKVIHLGGDECEFEPWETCPKCLALAKKQKLNEVKELQAIYMNHLGQRLAERGRQMGVWDEYIDFKMCDNTQAPLVFVWQNSSRYEAVKAKGFPIVMVPSNYAYLDYAQGIPSLEPWGDHTLRMRDVLAIPLPGGVVGGGACLWTESVQDEAAIEYMIYPRILAVSEALWHGKDRQSWKEFQKIISPAIALWKARGIKPAESVFQVQILPALPLVPGITRLYFQTELDADSTPIIYETKADGDDDGEKINVEVWIPRTIAPGTPFQVEERTFFKFGDGRYKRYAESHLGVGYIDSSSTPSSLFYPGAAAAQSLADGASAGNYYKDPNWVGYETEGDPVEVIFSFPEKRKISALQITALQKINSWIMAPVRIEVYDGANKLLADVTPSEVESGFGESVKRRFPVLFKTKTDRLRIRITPGKLPESHPRSGTPAWLFMDEIILRP